MIFTARLGKKYCIRESHQWFCRISYFVVSVFACPSEPMCIQKSQIQYYKFFNVFSEITERRNTFRVLVWTTMRKILFKHLPFFFTFENFSASCFLPPFCEFPSLCYIHTARPLTISIGIAHFGFSSANES